MQNTFKKKLSSDEIGFGNFPTGIPRIIEILLSISGLVVLAPVLALCSLLVVMGSRGPVLFRQLRVGRGGKVFVLYKFRTMVIRSKGSLITADNDHRVTSTGRFLRKTKLDELPELINVLIGDMAFVGPRPEVSEYVDLKNPLWRRLLGARPGITDPVTLRLRNEEEYLAEVVNKEEYYRDVLQPLKLKGSLNYLDRKSFLGDVKLIARTLKVILFPENQPISESDESLSYAK